VTEEIDIWRSAKLLLDKHGTDAELQAAQQIDAMIARGDSRGESAWKRILSAIKELQRIDWRGASVH
jgi:hypothetical protein